MLSNKFIFIAPLSFPHGYQIASCLEMTTYLDKQINKPVNIIITCYISVCVSEHVVLCVNVSEGRQQKLFHIKIK